MKKILALILAMALVLALAACGETKEAEVVENVDPNNNNIVIETPPAVVSGTGNNAGTYTPDTSLPSAAPTTVPTSAPTSVPPATAVPTAAPDGTTTTTDGSTTEGGDNADGNETGSKEDGYEDFKSSITNYEKTHGKDGYVNGDGVRLRVGPGVQYKTICFLDKNTKLLIVDELASGWCKIWYSDQIGYMYGRYVSLKPIEDTPVVPDTTPSPTPAHSATPKPTEAPEDPVVVEVP